MTLTTCLVSKHMPLSVLEKVVTHALLKAPDAVASRLESPGRRNASLWRQAGRA